MEIIKLVKNDNDRLCKIEEDLKFIIDCLNEIDDVKEKMSFLLEQKKKREQEQDYKLWLQQNIVVEFVKQTDNKLFFTYIKNTRQQFYNQIDKLIQLMNMNMINIGRLYVNKKGKEIPLFVKDLKILRSIIAMGYGNIELKDYSCKCLNIKCLNIDFDYDRDVTKYLDSLFERS